MKQPQHAMKSAYTLQSFATIFYVIFATLTYNWLGSDVSSPSFSSLVTKWQKAAYGVALPNFLVAGALYAHTASKLYFVRLFRGNKTGGTRHLHENTVLGWSVWLTLILICNGAAFVLAVGVPIFNYVVALAASLFASWFTYGIAGMFFLYDSYHDGGRRVSSWRRKPIGTTLAILTILAGAFICVAGLYVTIRGIKEAYESGEISTPFGCQASS